jgi:[acyl-carrier-protein] S-malonyltransferase
MVRSGGSQIAFVFPGQASQKAGMAAELLDGESAARAVFERGSQVLGLDLADICTRADDDLLSRTDVTQPALLTTCIAWLSVLRERGVLPQMVAGHSLGEFSAWVATEALDFESAVRLVRRRGEIMEDAAERNPGGMAAVIGLADRQVAEMCAEAGRSAVVVAANFNCPGQVVVSGQPEGLAKVGELAKRAGGRTISLRVSGAFHSPLMEDAARAFAALVAEVPVQDPKAPVVANATAEPVTDAAGVREAMTKQMTSPVLWTASVRRLIEEGASLFVEVGPGAVLTNLIARISADARAVPVGTPGQLQELLEEVKP